MTTDKTNTAGRPEPTRPARQGETCSCGAPAVNVLLCEEQRYAADLVPSAGAGRAAA